MAGCAIFDQSSELERAYTGWEKPGSNVSAHCNFSILMDLAIIALPENVSGLEGRRFQEGGWHMWCLNCHTECFEDTVCEIWIGCTH